MEITQMKSGDSVPKMEKDDEMPPDEQRCCQTGGGRWRCKNFRMNHGAAANDDSLPKTKLCENHYYGKFPYKKKKTSGNGETRALERGKKVTGEGDTADAIEEGGTAKFGNKKKNVKRTERSGQLKSLTKPVVETRAAKRRKMVMEGDLLLGETSNQPATNDNCVSDTITESAGIRRKRKRKNVKRTKRSGELKSLTRAKDKIKCLELSLELERKKLECTKLQGKLAEKEETRKTAETERTPADATASWEKMFSYLESRFQRKDDGNSAMECVESRISNLESQFLRMESEHSTMAGCVESRISKLESLVPGMENENSTMGCLESRISNLESLVQRMGNGNLTMAVESRISNLESLVLRSGKESSILRCVKLRNGVAESKSNAETSSRGTKDSHVYECKTKEKVLNVYDVGVNKHHESESEFPKYSAVNISSGCLHLSSGSENIEEGNGRGCSDVIQSQHGSSSQDQLDMRTSLGGLMDMLAMKYRRNRNDDKEVKWKSEADMLSSFEEDPELCMRAVCALHRQQISEDEISEKGLFHFSDVLRITTLANFLMEEDCKGDLKKSLEELEIFDPKGVVDCKRMARRYSIQLFSVYQNGKDPFFLPATTAKPK
ncbi:uncharacterized protein LOC113320819 isoform X2 [Papaver somniferum]|uniref:uncharacterized protein LOC113320819 isoform X2 n=1 Tax=Papaver somniferum TaxID=3469 RepID=UPI000E6FEF2A|nr:uncharacterized protein LOC113320819 isoform X2 [Papaver somniferum]